MEYGKLIAITGLSGLFELVASKNDGAVVKSLEDGSVKFASNRLHNFSHLESIEVYTQRENVNLVDVFKAMQNSDEKLPAANDNKATKAYFEKVFPTMDFERVYDSDRKKMVKWFTILTTNKVELKLSQPVEEEVEEDK